jgi:hypothetical protein
MQALGLSVKNRTKRFRPSYVARREIRTYQPRAGTTPLEIFPELLLAPRAVERPMPSQMPPSEPVAREYDIEYDIEDFTFVCDPEATGPSSQEFHKSITEGVLSQCLAAAADVDQSDPLLVLEAFLEALNAHALGQELGNNVTTFRTLAAELRGLKTAQERRSCMEAKAVFAIGNSCVVQFVDGRYRIQELSTHAVFSQFPDCPSSEHADCENSAAGIHPSRVIATNVCCTPVVSTAQDPATGKNTKTYHMISEEDDPHNNLKIFPAALLHLLRRMGYTGIMVIRSASTAGAYGIQGKGTVAQVAVGIGGLIVDVVATAAHHPEHALRNPRGGKAMEEDVHALKTALALYRDPSATADHEPAVGAGPNDHCWVSARGKASASRGRMAHRAGADGINPTVRGKASRYDALLEEGTPGLGLLTTAELGGEGNVVAEAKCREFGTYTGKRRNGWTAEAEAAQWDNGDVPFYFLQAETNNPGFRLFPADKWEALEEISHLACGKPFESAAEGIGVPRNVACEFQRQFKAFKAGEPYWTKEEVRSQQCAWVCACGAVGGRLCACGCSGRNPTVTLHTALIAPTATHAGSFPVGQ